MSCLSFLWPIKCFCKRLFQLSNTMQGKEIALFAVDIENSHNPASRPLNRRSYILNPPASKWDHFQRREAFGGAIERNVDRASVEKSAMRELNIYFHGVILSGWLDLNQRPLRPERSAPANLSYTLRSRR